MAALDKFQRHQFKIPKSDSKRILNIVSSEVGIWKKECLPLLSNHNSACLIVQ